MSTRKTVLEVFGEKNLFAKLSMSAFWLESGIMLGSCRLQGWHRRRSQKDWGYRWMRTTNKRPTDSRLVGLRRLLTMVHCRILHIVRASHSTNVEECSSRLERTMRNRRSGANGKTGLRTCPHVEHEIFGARSANVWIPKMFALCSGVRRQSGILCHKAFERSWEEPSHSGLNVRGSVLFALKICTQISMASSVKFIPIVRVSDKYLRKRHWTWDNSDG